MNVEKVRVRIFEDDKKASQAVARRMAEVIREKATEKRPDPQCSDWLPGTLP